MTTRASVVERSIVRRADGLYLRTADRKNQSKTIDIPIDSLPQGRAWRDEAAAVRQADGVLSEEWAERIDEQRVARAASAGRAQPRLLARTLIEDAGDDWLNERDERMRASDWSRSGLMNLNRGNLRPTTLGRDESFVSAHLKNPSRGLVGLYTTELTNKVVQGWLTSRAADGDQRSSQLHCLGLLVDLVGRLPASHRPDDFPWKSVHGVDPRNPKKRQPNVEKIAHGKPGAKAPALLFHEMGVLAANMRSSGRIVIYVMALIALRRGEVFGLTLRHVVYRGDRMYILVRQQRDLGTGLLHAWLKSDAAWRDLPVPRILERYLLDYIVRYHASYDVRLNDPFGDPDDAPEESLRWLVVTGTGRDVDGSFMALHPATWGGWWEAAINVSKLTYADIGYELDPHHLRRSWLSYLLRAPAILADIAQRATGPRPDADAALPVLVAWLEQQLALATAAARSVIFGAAVSEFAAHEIEGDDDERAASPTSFRSYYRSIGELDDASFLDIADAIDVIAAHELPDGLDASTDEHDDAFVVTAANPEWLLVHEAAHLMGVSDQTASKLARDGVLEARLAYFADGDREPPGLRWALSAAAVDAWADRRRNGIAVLAAGEKVLHLDRNVVRRLAADPDSGLTLRTIDAARHPFLDRGDVTELLATLLGAVAAVLAAGGALTARQLRDRFVAHVTDSPELARIFSHPEKMPTARLDPWVAQLLAVGAVRRLANGRLRLADDSKVRVAAERAVAEVESFKFGRDRSLETAERLARKSERPRDQLRGAGFRDADGNRVGSGGGRKQSPAMTDEADTTRRHNGPEIGATKRHPGGRTRTVATRSGTSAAVPVSRPHTSRTARRCRRPGGLSRGCTLPEPISGRPNRIVLGSGPTQRKVGRMRMEQRRIAAAVVAVSLVAASCGGGGSGESADTRRVFVDYSSDEFASFSLFNYPAKVKVRQGDILEFKQTWTGEPHTVTGGTTVNEALRDGQAWLDFFDGFEGLLSSGAELPNPDDPGDATVGEFARAVNEAKDVEARDQFVRGYEGVIAMGVALPPLDTASAQPFSELVDLVEKASDEFFSGLPSAFDDDDQLAQNVSQPCFLDEGGPPEDQATPCDEADQKQPAFTGRQSYYNSGVIRYEGERSNTFRVQIADDAETGSFLFYCAIHGLGQKSQVEIVDADAEIPTQSKINSEVRAETSKVAKSLGAIFRDAKDDLKVELPGLDEPVEGPFAGLPGEEHTAINEFVPRKMTVKAGEPITWKMMGSDHSISFNVPKYFPIMEFLDDGTVRINPKMYPAAGDAVAYEEPDDEEGPPGEEDGGPPSHDGGTFDGDGFWSSGLIGGQPYLDYTMRISKPGTYAYACLLHPPMIGEIRVT